MKGFKRYGQTLLILSSIGFLASSAGVATVISIPQTPTVSETKVEEQEYAKQAKAYETLAEIARARAILDDPEHDQAWMHIYVNSHNGGPGHSADVDMSDYLVSIILDCAEEQAKKDAGYGVTKTTP